MVGKKRYRDRKSVTNCIGFQPSKMKVILRNLGQVNLPNLFRMFQEGVDPNKINDLSTKAGFAVGTATLIDEVGVDIAMHAATNIGCNPMYGARMNGGDVAFLEKLFDAGFGGKKTGKGVFDYADKKKGVVSDGFKKLQSEVSTPLVVKIIF